MIVCDEGVDVNKDRYNICYLGFLFWDNPYYWVNRSTGYDMLSELYTEGL